MFCEKWGHLYNWKLKAESECSMNMMEMGRRDFECKPKYWGSSPSGPTKSAPMPIECAWMLERQAELLYFEKKTTTGVAWNRTHAHRLRAGLSRHIMLCCRSWAVLLDLIHWLGYTRGGWIPGRTDVLVCWSSASSRSTGPCKSIQWWAKSNRDLIESRFESHRRFDSNITLHTLRFDTDSFQKF